LDHVRLEYRDSAIVSIIFWLNFADILFWILEVGELRVRCIVLERRGIIVGIGRGMKLFFRLRGRDGHRIC
jgi:hypothetical protein